MSAGGDACAGSLLESSFEAAVLFSNADKKKKNNTKSKCKPFVESSFVKSDGSDSNEMNEAPNSCFSRSITSVISSSVSLLVFSFEFLLLFE